MTTYYETTVPLYPHQLKRANTHHRILCSLFNQQANRNYLYRQKGRNLLVRTAEPVSWEAGGGDTVQKTLPVQGNIAFEVEICPVKRVREGSKHKEVVKTKQELFSWLEQKVSDAGLSLISGQVRDLSPRQIKRGVPGDRVLVFVEAQITDPVKWEKAFFEGIGRRKAYGFGMIDLTT